ncbi:hypothetical protein KR222_009670 [Zaprionus bogoriensis]|nr:hypothetical protein KR222_009670 [Zaprionus bogoriensis]
MDYLTPPDQTDEMQRSIGGRLLRLTSRSASPRGRERANSLTPPLQDTANPTTSPLPLRKRPPRHAQLNELFRPRCNTDPSRSSSSRSSSSAASSSAASSSASGSSSKPKATATASRSVLGSLLRQTLKVTTASVGFSASEER